ncbi:MAG: sugar phosphate isomerase/epimerase [Gemmatimonadetes bacterium]|nr:sugar phosphate isomerase/epimerase [Gemmatimonadota bacterium]
MIRDLVPKQKSISTCFSYAHTLEGLFPLINTAGFTHVSLGEKSPHSRYLGISERKSLRHLLVDSDLKMDTIHGSRLDLPKALYNLSATAEAAAFLDVPVVVVHASSFNFDASEFNERIKPVLDTCEALVPIAEESGVKFALENVLPGPATEFVGYALERLPSGYFGFCYDSSHDQIGGPKPFTLLESLADRLLALHLSDRIRDHVDHVVPGEGFIDW